MALQVWLPLNNDFNNKGLDNTVSVTTSNVSIESGGKNGGCTQVTSSKRIVIGAKPYMSPKGDNEFSIAMWVNAATFNYIIAFSSFELRLLSTLAQFRTGSGPAPYTINAQKNGTYNTNTWYHICGTWSSKAGRVRVYVNGELGAETNERPGEYQAGSSTMNLVYGGDWKISDFRIYDNELSELDVKELYWSKIYELTPQWKHSGELSVLGDASGVGPLTRQTIGDVSLSGNTLYFNGTTGSTIKFDGFGAVGGALSIWYRYESTISGNQLLFIDPVSKMAVGYNGSGAFIVSTVSQARYSATGATANKWNHVVVNYGTDGKATGCWVNGVTPATASTEYWSTAGTIACVGARAKSATIDAPFKGYINEIKVFQSQLTANDVQYLYKRGLMDNNWTPDEPVWLRILHHNAPATNLFTQANCKDNDDENLFSKLKVLFDNDNFRRADGNYEFMAKERLEANSAEQVYRWTQTSNPTASTCTGYNLISQTNNPGRNFGLSFGPTGNCIFSNKNAWWCAVGCWTAYQGGIPGFNNVVKTGYMDLYVRADKGGVPSEYVELEYIQSTGTQYIDIDITPSTTTELIVDAALTEVGANITIAGSHYMTGTTLVGRFHMGTYQSKWHFGVGGNSAWYNFTSPTPDTSRHTFRLDGVGNSYVDSNTYKINGSITSATTIGLFCAHRFTAPSTNEYVQATKMKLYRATVKNGGSVVADLVPVKRISDSVVGMYDIIRQMFFTNVGSGTFTAGPEI